MNTEDRIKFYTAIGATLPATLILSMANGVQMTTGQVSDVVTTVGAAAVIADLSTKNRGRKSPKGVPPTDTEGGV